MSQTQSLSRADQQRRLVLDLIQNPKQLEQFEKVLPSILTKERFARCAITSITKNPRLLMCTKESLMRSLMEAAQVGLEVDGRRAHLVPYGEECKMIVDYKGLAELMKRSGEVSDIHLDVVHEKDEFDFAFGTGRWLKHKPKLVPDRGRVIAFYSFINLANGGTSFEVMPIHEVVEIRDNSPGWKAFVAKKVSSSVWDTSFNEMGKKTVLRRHSKTLTLSPDVMDAVERDDDPAPVAVKPNQTVEVDTDLSWLDDAEPPVGGVKVDPKEPLKDAPNKDPKPAERPTEPTPAETPAPTVDAVEVDPKYQEQIIEGLKRHGLTEKDLHQWSKGSQSVEAAWIKTKSVAEMPDAQARWYLTNAEVIFGLVKKLKDNLSKTA